MTKCGTCWRVVVESDHVVTEKASEPGFWLNAIGRANQHAANWKALARRLRQDVAYHVDSCRGLAQMNADLSNELADLKRTAPVVPPPAPDVPLTESFLQQLSDDMRADEAPPASTTPVDMSDCEEYSPSDVARMDRQSADIENRAMGLRTAPTMPVEPKRCEGRDREGWRCVMPHGHMQLEHIGPGRPTTPVQVEPGPPGRASLYTELSRAINRVSAENGSNTPDYILASFLEGCLRSFDSAVASREEWYGRASDGPAGSLVSKEDTKP